MRRILFLLAMITPSVLLAQDWSTRADDQIYTRDDLQTELVGGSITFYDNGVSRFENDGRYSYTYDQGGTAHGTYEILNDGTICIDFVNGFSRCDLYVRNGDRMVLLTQDGLRFPVRP